MPSFPEVMLVLRDSGKQDAFDKISFLTPGPIMQRYTTTAIVLHWLIALLIIGAFTLGLVMTDIPGFSPTKLRYYSWHKWAGVTVLLLAAVRLLWRLKNRPPELSASMPAWQRGAAHGLHHLLYVFIFAVPLSGYFYTLAAGFPVVYFGLFQLPVLIAKNPALAETLKTVHYWLNMTMAALVLLHVLAALKHTFVDRDGTLRRMLPGRSL
jgi:cytochrome b561